MVQSEEVPELIDRVESERVAILAIIHGRRDLSSVWAERER